MRKGAALMIYTVTLNPAIDKTVTIPNFCLDSVNRVVDCRLDPGGKGINVSKVLSALGQPSVVFTLLAGDTGRTLRAMLAQAGLPVVAHELPGQTRQNLKVVDRPGIQTPISTNPAPRQARRRSPACGRTCWPACSRVTLWFWPAACQPALRRIPMPAGFPPARQRAPRCL